MISSQIRILLSEKYLNLFNFIYLIIFINLIKKFYNLAVKLIFIAKKYIKVYIKFIGLFIILIIIVILSLLDIFIIELKNKKSGKVNRLKAGATKGTYSYRDIILIIIRNSSLIAL